MKRVIESRLSFPFITRQLHLLHFTTPANKKTLMQKAVRPQFSNSCGLGVIGDILVAVSTPTQKNEH
jgi:hypothetical protein